MEQCLSSPMTRSRGSMRRTWPSVVTTWLQDGTYILPLDRPYLGFWWHDCDRPFLSFFSQSAIRAARCMCENEVSPSDILSSSGSLLLPLVHFGQSKPEGHSGLDTADSDLMHHQFRLSLLQWNPGPARKHPTNIVSAACGKFHAVILQEASDHVPHISDQFRAYTGNTDLAILLNKDTFEPDPIVNTFKADSTSKGTRGMILLIVRGLLRRPSLTGSPTARYTFTMLWLRNVMLLLIFFSAYMDICESTMLTSLVVTST